jgi:predicted porin
MKIAFITLATLAVTGTAFAQSSVEITGGTAIGLKYQNAKSDKPVSHTVSLVNNQESANNVTFRATEQLEDGMSVSSYLNIRYGPDDGTFIGGSAFKETSVSLQGKFGQFTYGRFNSPVDNMVHPTIDPYVPLGLGTTIYGGPLDAISRYNGMIQYATPIMGNVETRVMFVPKGNLNSTVTTSEIAVKYQDTNLGLGIGFTKNSGNTAGTANFKDRDVFTVGALYNFGFAKVGVSFHRVDAYKSGATTIAQSDRKNLGIRVPLDAQISYKFGYETQKSVGALAVNALANGIDYYLSKRTTLSFDIGKVSSSNLARNDQGINYVFGLKHRF